MAFFGLIHSTTGQVFLKNYEVSDLTGNPGLHFRPILNPGLMQVLSETLELVLIVLYAFVWLLFSRNWAVFVRIWNSTHHSCSIKPNTSQLLGIPQKRISTHKHQTSVTLY